MQRGAVVERSGRRQSAWGAGSPQRWGAESRVMGWGDRGIGQGQRRDQALATGQGIRDAFGGGMAARQDGGALMAASGDNPWAALRFLGTGGDFVTGGVAAGRSGIACTEAGPSGCLGQNQAPDQQQPDAAGAFHKRDTKPGQRAIKSRISPSNRVGMHRLVRFVREEWGRGARSPTFVLKNLPIKAFEVGEACTSAVRWDGLSFRLGLCLRGYDPLHMIPYLAASP